MQKTLGQRIRELRQGRKLSLRELGEQLKGANEDAAVSAAFLSDLENGRRFPSETMLAELAQVLNTTIDDLRSCDQRPPSREMQSLVDQNAQYAFAFRRVMEIVQEKHMSPEEIVKRIEKTKT